MQALRNAVRPISSSHRRGFTLVEMLVSVALVLLMMSMFATIFQVAVGLMTRQRGLAENDQRQRLTDTLLRSDLDKRTFRDVIPFVGQTTGASDIGRKGYLHISEGDPFDDTDDVLQLTVGSDQVLRDGDVTPYAGRAMGLTIAGQAPITGFPGVFRNPNQPAFDDGRLGSGGVSDRVSSSPYAEVVYFLRRGTLYRRVVLIRKPLRDSFQGQPSADPNGLGDDLIRGTAPTATTAGYDVDDLVTGQTTGSLAANANFLNDFDFSAHFEPAATAATAADELVFHSVGGGRDSLSNAAFPATFSLGVPNHRFGFDPRSGRPISYAAGGVLPGGGATVGDDPLETFFGRFTHQETSHTAFRYPGQLDRGADNQFGTNDDVYPLFRVRRNGSVLGSDGVITLGGASTVRLDGPRAGEDILLTNVLAFDIKVYDEHPSVQSFVDLGHVTVRPGSSPPEVVGFYGHRANQVPGFGPINLSIPAADLRGADGDWGRSGIDDDGNGTTDDISEQGWPGSDDPWNRVFDTWHPRMSANTQFVPLGRVPPFRPTSGVSLGPDLQPGRAGVDDDGNSSTDTLPADWGEVGFWDDVIPDAGPDGKPGKRGIDDDGDGIVDNASELLWPGTDDTAYDLGPDGQPGRAGINDNNPNALPAPADQLVDNQIEVGFPRSDDVQLRTRPMRAIQIRVRVRDVSSGLIRDITIQHSLLDSRPQS
jgi:prepilin-type N-terminal cleavage/methylation domain-containing protein